MASLDVRDVLNLPQDGSGGNGNGAGSRPAKKQKTTASAAAASALRPNLKGLAREVQSLGGSNPIAIVPQLMSQFKKRRVISKKPAARWELRPFTNSARDDRALVLKHWRRKPLPAVAATATATASTTATAATTPLAAREAGQGAEDDDQAAKTQNGEGNGDTATENEKSMAVAAAETQTEAQTESPAAAAAPEPAAPMEDSAFAKFNAKVVVPQYSDDQYHANLQHPDWTKEETDYLLGLVKDFDLRWPLIWDRYDFRSAEDEAMVMATGDDDNNNGGHPAASASTALVPASQQQQTNGSSRTMEDLKARYYEIAAKMMAVQKPAQYMTQSEYNLHSMMANFDPHQEKLRKDFVTSSLSRSREEVRDEEALLLEVRRIMARVDRTNEERRELYSRLDFPHADTDISTFKTSAGLQQLLQNLLVSNEKSKKRRSLAAAEGAVHAAAAGGSGAGAGVGAGGGGSGAAGAGGSHGAAEGGGRRDSIAASASGGGGGHSRRESGIGGGANTERNGASVEVTPSAAVAAAAAGGGANGYGAAGGKNSKKGGAQAERRKLTEQEKDVYGVSYHDRLGSGPTFRYEKINKLFTHKSGQQQLRITNILNELNMPARLFMPTASVTAHFEQLVTSVVQLVDFRKVSDKLDGEIRIEEQRKAERDKAKGRLAGGGGDEAAAAASTDGKKAGGVAEATKQKKQAEAGASNGSLKTEDLGDGDGGETLAGEDATAAAAVAASDTKAAVERGGAEEAKSKSDENGLNDSNSANATHKRSASVLSVASDKSSKRQKK